MMSVLIGKHAQGYQNISLLLNEQGERRHWLLTKHNRTQNYLTLILKRKKNAYSSFKFLILYLCSWTDGTEVQEEHLLL